MSLDERIVEVVDELEKYRSAVLGQSDLAVGPRTVAWIMEKAEGLLLDCQKALNSKTQ